MEADPMRGKRALIVEDHDGTRLALRSIFKRNGWQVSSAATMAGGLDLLHSSPDCIVLDLLLPDGDGETILRKVRTDNLPARVVAVTTGVDDPSRLAAVRELNPDVLLCKPIDLNVVFRMCESEVG